MDQRQSLAPEIHFRNTVPNSQIIDTIKQRTEKLHTLHNQILHCRVRLNMPHTGHRTQANFVATIELSVPGNRLVTTGKHQDNLVSAIQDGFDTAERRVQDHARKRRMRRKQHDDERTTGVVQEVDLPASQP